MSNVLKAILNIQANPVTNIKAEYTGRNTINNVGEALEAYVQDAFSDSLGDVCKDVREQNIENTFSYLGNQNNPPDIMLKNSDAIEVKKIQGIKSGIPLNSSYPKNKLYSDDSKITEACRNSEEWEEKDIIYSIGITSDDSLKHLWFIYGDCYAASRGIYSRIGKSIKDGIDEIQGIELSETKELGRVNRVDPLGITYLRLRGMWGIDNPIKVFGDHYEGIDFSKELTLACILRDEKYSSFPEVDRKMIEDNENINIEKIKIKNPDNPAQRLNARIITLEVL